MDRIDQLRIFIRVAHSGGFTTAAGQLGVPQRPGDLLQHQAVCYASQLGAPMPVQLVYPHQRYLSHRVRIFGDWLAEVLAPCLE